MPDFSLKDFWFYAVNYLPDHSGRDMNAEVPGNMAGDKHPGEIPLEVVPVIVVQ
jgi:hypothetical protein